MRAGTKEGQAPKNWCFQTVGLEKALESPVDSKEIEAVNPKGNQSWILIGRTELKLKLQYFGHLMWTDSLEKSLLIVGKIEGRRRRGWQGKKWFDGLTDSMDMSLSKLQEMLKEREAWRAAIHGVAKSQIRLNDWKITKELPKLCWLIVARVDIIVLFLTLQEKLSVFQHSE